MFSPCTTSLPSSPDHLGAGPDLRSMKLWSPGNLLGPPQPAPRIKQKVCHTFFIFHNQHLHNEGAHYELTNVLV